MSVKGINKANWFKALSSLPAKNRVTALKASKGCFLKDIQKLIKFIGRSKKVKILPAQRKIFKKHRGFLSRFARCKVPKLKKLALSKVSGGFFGILAALIPAIVSLVSSVLPKVLG